MNPIFNKLKKNKTFKFAIALIIIFFALLTYFNKASGNDCQCLTWDCGDSYYQDITEPYGWVSVCSCVENEECKSTCGPGYYVCNRLNSDTPGCCPYDPASPTPTPTPDGCNSNSWSSCSATCGGGTKTNDCGLVVACNEQPCCTPTCGGTEMRKAPLFAKTHYSCDRRGRFLPRKIEKVPENL